MYVDVDRPISDASITTHALVDPIEVVDRVETLLYFKIEK